MKTITIGRGEGVDITIEDDKISRCHAVIRIYTFGKIEIVDMSKNGTFLNGKRLVRDTPITIKRKDVVSFAEVSKLDWSRIPDNTKYFKIGALILGAIIALILLFNIGSFCYNTFFGKKPVPTEYQEQGGDQQGGAQQGGAQQGNAQQGVAQKDSAQKDTTKKADAQDRDYTRSEIRNIFSKSPKPQKQDSTKDKDKKKTDKKENGNTQQDSDNDTPVY